MRYVFLLCLFLISANAAHTYTMIVLGSYTEKSSALAGIDWLEQTFLEDEDYQAIKYEIKPSLHLNKGETYYSISLRPFENESEAKQLLPVVQRYRKDAFISNYDQDEMIDFRPKALKAPVVEPVKNVLTTPPPVPMSLIEEQETITYAIAAIIVVFIILLLLMMRRNRALIEENMQLERDAGKLLAKAHLKEAFFKRLEQEIKGPLNIMLGYTHALAGTKLDEKQSQYLGKVHYTADLLASTLDDMHQFSEIESTGLTIENETFNLNAVLNNISTIMGPIAEQKGVELVFNIDNKVPATMLGDASRIDQMLRSLLRFSLQHTEHGSVVLHVERKANEKKVFDLLIEITDTSGGLDAETVQRLFDLNLTPDKLVAKESKEWGVLIAKTVIDAMGGTLHATSRLGEGTTFTLHLELGIPENFDQRQYRLPSKTNMYKKVLIADANLQAATSLDKMVSYFHHTADIVANLDGVKKRISESDYDIIYLDSRLVQQDHHGSVVTIKQNCSCKIVLVGNESLHSVRIGSGEVDLQMKKPFNHQDVFDTIVELYAEEVAQNDVRKVFSKSDLKEFAGSTILLAEDNDINQGIIKNLLKDTGINLLIAANGKEAVEQLVRHGEVDLIIMDIDMPIMNGYEAARWIRENNRYSHIPIIALTAQVKPEDVERSKKAGMQEHLGKPYKMVVLYNALYKYLMVGKQLPQQKSKALY